MQDKDIVTHSLDDDGVLTLFLGRSEKHNALNNALITGMIHILAEVQASTQTRAVIIRGTPQSFCSGMDVQWMQRTVKAGDDVRRLSFLLNHIRTLKVPVVAVVEGPCFGAGVALAACCDLVIASEQATFSLPAIRMGLVPAVTTSFLVHTIGVKLTKRLSLTGEVIEADKARDMQLVDAVCMQEQIDDTLQYFLDNLLRGAPHALGEMKHVIREAENEKLDDAALERAALRTNRCRQTDEARDGMSAFLEKRLPKWLSKDKS